MDIFHQITLLVVLLLSSKGRQGDRQRLHRAGGDYLGRRSFTGGWSGADLGIDRFMSEARALTNPVGNGVATVVVAKWVKELDAKQMDDVLNNRVPANKRTNYPLKSSRPVLLAGVRPPRILGHSARRNDTK